MIFIAYLKMKARHDKSTTQQAMCGLVFFVWLMSAVCPLSAAPGDERWGHEFYAPDFGTVNALVFTTNGDLICGGLFTSVAGVSGTPNIARWDGSNWSGLGGGLASGTVFAVLSVGNDIYMGGSFTSVQGQNITNLARWNGTNWSAVGGGVTGGSVRALAWHNGALYVGGLFTNAGGKFVGFIAAWDGNSWSTLGGGLQATSPSSSAVPVSSLLSFNGALYAGGRFFNVGGVNANNVARWNGTMWESLGTGADNGTDGAVVTLAGATNGTLYLGGGFVHAGTNTVNYVASWNGTQWSALDGGVSDPVIAGVGGVVMSGSDLFVCGTFLYAGTNTASGLARWDGTSWSRVSFPGRHPMSRIVSYGSRMVASGRLQNLMVQAPKTGLIQFDGEKWTIMGGSVGGQFDTSSVQTSGTSSGKVQVSGYFGVTDGSGQRPMVAQWDGKGWKNLGNSLFVAQLDTSYYVHDFLTRNGVTYAAGQFSGGANGVMILSNNLWMDIGAPLSSSGTALVEYRGDLFAGHGSGISRWTGSGWTNVGTGLNGPVYDLIVLDDALYAGGSFNHSGATAVSNIARWDGTTWSGLGMGVDSPVFTLAKWQDDLYVGGSFAQTGQGIALGVAKWHNSSWFPLGTGFGGGLSSVFSLCVLSDGRVFAAGDFTRSGATPLNYVAAWDGTNWNPLGSGVNAPVRSLATDETDLYLTGSFTTAGNATSLRFARWRLPQDLRLGVSAPTNTSHVTLTIRGEIGNPFATEASSNLIQWTALLTNNLITSPMLLPISTNGLPGQFFRLRRLP